MPIPKEFPPTWDTMNIIGLEAIGSLSSKNWTVYQALTGLYNSYKTAKVSTNIITCFGLLQQTSVDTEHFAALTLSSLYNNICKIDMQPKAEDKLDNYSTGVGEML